MERTERDKAQEKQVMYYTIAHTSLNGAQRIFQGSLQLPASSLPMVWNILLASWVSSPGHAPFQCLGHLHAGRAWEISL